MTTPTLPITPNAALLGEIENCEMILETLRGALTTRGPQASTAVKSQAGVTLSRIRRELCAAADTLDESAQREAARR